MRTATYSVKEEGMIDQAASELAAARPAVVFMFAGMGWFKDGLALVELASKLKGALCFGCSTAGEISSSNVDDGTLSSLAMGFDDPDSRIEWSEADVEDGSRSFDAGKALANGISKQGLRHALVIGPGVGINGSELIRGVSSSLPLDCTLSGGLAGDAASFSGTFQMTPTGMGKRKAFLVGFYGSALDVRCACWGGWKPFGPARKATKAEGNVLMELDGEPALSVYKRYLGNYAADLPGSGLLFPFETRSASRELTGIIRTILAVDEEAGSLVLAGDVEQGGYLTLMHASTDALAMGAYGAAKALGVLAPGPKAVLAISCVGRKLVMGARCEEEAEALAEVVGEQAAIAGFYSNGEICGDSLLSCSLHNQTMTLTSFQERGPEE